MTPHASYLILLIAATAVVKGAGWLVEAACAVAGEHRAERYLAGLTVAALAVSVPQVALAAWATLSGEPALAAGIAVGGCAANIGLVLGGSLLVLRLNPAGAQVALLAGGVATAGALVGYQIRDGLLSRSEGLCLLAVFCAACLACRRAWVAGRWRTRRADATTAGCRRSAGAGRGPADGPGRRPVLPRLVLGTLLLAAGSRYAVVAGGALAAYLRLAPDVAGRTMLSLGACVPEAAAAAAAALRGWPDLALGA